MFLRKAESLQAWSFVDKPYLCFADTKKGGTGRREAAGFSLCCWIEPWATT